MIFRLCTSILLLTALPGRAQTPVKDTRPPAIADARIRSILVAMALDFTEDSSAGPLAFAIHLDPRLVTLLNHPNGFSLSACFDGPVDLMKLNQWNRQHNSTRAYTNEKGCASLASDVKFGGAPTNPMIQDFISVFCTDVVVFARYLAAPPPGPDTPPASPAAAVPPLDQLPLPLGALSWSQFNPAAKRPPVPPAAVGFVPGLVNINSSVSLKYDPDLWRPATPHAPGQFAFSHSSGAAHALIISEPIPVPLDSMEDIVLANAQSVDPHATVVFRHRRWVKGAAYWFLRMEATVETVPMVYWGYFQAGTGGAVQVVTYTEKRHLAAHEQAFTDFLNGLSFTR